MLLGAIYLIFWVPYLICFALTYLPSESNFTGMVFIGLCNFLLPSKSFWSISALIWTTNIDTMGDHTSVQTNTDLQNEVKGYVAGGIRWCASELGAHPTKLTREGHLVTKANKSSDNIVSAIL